LHWQKPGVADHFRRRLKSWLLRHHRHPPELQGNLRDAPSPPLHLLLQWSLLPVPSLIFGAVSGQKQPVLLTTLQTR
jgi:hypothetical protein